MAPVHAEADDVRCQAHDLRNKLQVVVGFCDLLLAPTGTLEDRQRASRMIGNIRAAAQDSARIASAMIAPRHATVGLVDLNALLLEEVGVLCQDLLRQNINVGLDRFPSLPLVHVDATSLGRAILNLTCNARDAIVGQSGRRTSGMIRISTSLPPVTSQIPCVLLTVADDGPGMNEDTLKLIWQAGFTTKEDRHGMRGYGLASVRAFVDASGGMIEVESRTGEGTTFTMVLPCARELPVGV